MPSESLTEVLRTMAEHDVNQLPVVQGRELTGMLDRGDVMRFIQVRRDLGEQATRLDGREPADAAPREATPRAS
jgi:CBS domain-containing protein